MRRALLCSLVVSVCFVSEAVLAQEGAKAPQTTYRFSLSAEGPDLVLRVTFDKDRIPRKVSAYRAGASQPFQQMQECRIDKSFFPDWRYPRMKLLQAVDINFDGFKDLELVAAANMPHFGNTFYCGWVWDNVRQRFRYVPDFGMADPIPIPKRKQITSRRHFFGAEWSETYVWNGDQLQLVASRTLNWGSNNIPPECATYLVEKRVGGKMKILKQELVGHGKNGGFDLDDRGLCLKPTASSGSNK